MICAGSGNSERQKEKGSLPSHEYDPGQVMMLLWHYYSQSIASLGCFLWVLESSVDLVERMNPLHRGISCPELDLKVDGGLD